MKKKSIMGLIAVLDLLVNIVNKVRTIENGSISLGIIAGATIALCDIMLLFTIIELANKPVLSMVLLSLSQGLRFIFMLLDGATLDEVYNDIGLTGILVIVALFYHAVHTYKEVSKNKELTKTLKDKVINTINYKRTIYSIKIHVRIILYSLIISSVLSLAGSETLVLMNDNISFRVYSAFVLVIPTVLILGIVTTSYIAYDIFLAKILFEIYTIYLLYSIGKFDFIQIIYIIVEIITVVYAYILCKREKAGNKDEKEK